MLRVSFYALCTLCLITFCFLVGGMPLNDGKRAKIGEFKYQVALLEEDDYIANCGGGIIDAKFILTAAHCVIEPIENEFKSTGLFVMAGAVDLYDDAEITAKVRVVKIWVPDEYPNKNADPDEPYLSIGDIAVLELEHPLTLNKVSPGLPELNKIDLATVDSDYADRIAVITGYGLYNVDWASMKFDEHEQVIHIGDDTSSNKLHYAEARVMANEACKSAYHPSIKPQHLCANVLHCPRGQCSKPGICQGDSGSPLTLDGSVIIGVASCASLLSNTRIDFAIYTRVSSYLSFIENAMAGVESTDARVAIWNGEIKMFQENNRNLIDK